jgi:hypothetical protein
VLVALPACALALGVQNDPTVAIAQLCECPEINATIEPDNCESTLETRLSLAPSGTRADWLSKYASSCTKCAKAAECFYEPPTCVGSTNACARAEECCSYQQKPDPNACDSGICE